MDNTPGFDNIAVLKCKEKDFRHNIVILCENTAKTIQNIPTIVSKGRYFYFILKNYDEVKNLSLKGKFIL